MASAPAQGVSPSAGPAGAWCRCLTPTAWCSRGAGRHGRVPRRRLVAGTPHGGGALDLSTPRAMAYHRTEQPAFSWSHSRQRCLDACPRRYYACHNGWERGAPPLARAAWTLKQLTAYPLALGSAVHAQARRVAEAARDGRPAPEYHHSGYGEGPRPRPPTLGRCPEPPRFLGDQVGHLLGEE